MLGGTGTGLQFSVHAAVLSISGVVALALLGAVVARYRDERIARPICLLFAATAIWTLTDAAQLVVRDPATMEGLIRLRSASAGAVGPLVLWLVLVYVDRASQLTRARLAALLVVPSISTALLLSGTWADLVTYVESVDTLVDPVTGADYTTAVVGHGWWFSVSYGYTYLTVSVALVLLVRSFVDTRDVTAYRMQTVALLLAIVLPVVVNVSYESGLIAVDLTAVTFVVGLAVVAAAIFRWELLTLVPIARDTAIDNVDEGFFVLDREDRIVDVNPCGSALLGSTATAPTDRPVEDVVSQFGDVLGAVGPTEEITEEIAVETDDGPRYWEVTASPILDSRDRPVGRVLLVKDVTERVERKKQLQERTAELATQTEALERQNERLEEFADVLSHDLRNPLGVAESYLERARETGDPDDFDAVEEGLDRIDQLVEDLLTMARQGQTVGESGRVALADLARTAWRHVDTVGATLEVETDAAVDGDEARLLQVFENLFRNAIEHGSTGPDGSAGQETSTDADARSGSSPASRAGRGRDTPLHDGSGDAVVSRDDSSDATGLTVRVGAFEDGFFVEDDGPGIPEEDREQIFERGFTSVASGTGLGLSIVKLAVEAHGWTVRATESAAGGARFEVRGVDEPGEHDRPR